MAYSNTTNTKLSSQERAIVQYLKEHSDEKYPASDLWVKLPELSNDPDMSGLLLQNLLKSLVSRGEVARVEIDRRAYFSVPAGQSEKEAHQKPSGQRKDARKKEEELRLKMEAQKNREKEQELRNQLVEAKKERSKNIMWIILFVVFCAGSAVAALFAIESEMVGLFLLLLGLAVLMGFSCKWTWDLSVRDSKLKIDGIWMELHRINPDTIRERKKIRRSRILVAAVCIAIVLAIPISVFATKKAEEKRIFEEKTAALLDAITPVLEEYGLKDVTVEDPDDYQTILFIESFGSLTNKQKLDVFYKLDEAAGSLTQNSTNKTSDYSGLTIRTSEHRYRAVFSGSSKNAYLYDDAVSVGYCVFEGNNPDYVPYRGSYGSSSGSSSGKTKCIICNGTGSVKYYTGDSDLEAILDGYDPYTFGPCTSCGGDGWG